MAKPKGSPKTGGRQKGTPKKLTADLRTAILGALEAKGGQAYLEEVAGSDPRTFCALLGKVLPMQIEGDANVVAVPILNVSLTRDKPAPSPARRPQWGRNQTRGCAAGSALRFHQYLRPS